MHYEKENGRFWINEIPVELQNEKYGNERKTYC